MQQINLRSIILDKINNKGGWVNCHAHFDRAYTVTPKSLDQSHAFMEEKWMLVDAMKRTSTEEMYAERIEQAVKIMIAQRVRLCATFIDVDPLTQLRALNAALFVKKKYKKHFTLLIINQVLKGVLDQTANRWARKALPYVDIIGGLPSKDRPNHRKHLEILFSWAKETGKMVHVHIDQENNPDEHDSELLARETIRFGLEGKVVAVHAISVAAQNPKRRKEIYTLFGAAGISVVCCPSAALSMKAIPKRSYIHNSIVPVPELLDAGIPVAIGVDNVADIYQPLVDGDLYTELRMLAESNRFYDIDKLAGIATTNGKIALGMS